MRTGVLWRDELRNEAGMKSGSVLVDRQHRDVHLTPKRTRISSKNNSSQSGVARGKKLFSRLCNSTDMRNSRKVPQGDDRLTALRFDCGNDGWQAGKSSASRNFLWSHQHSFTATLFRFMWLLCQIQIEAWRRVRWCEFIDRELFCVGFKFSFHLVFPFYPGTCFLSESEISLGRTTNGLRADWIIVFIYWLWISLSQQPVWSVTMKCVNRQINTANSAMARSNTP